MKQRKLVVTRFSVWCYRILLMAYPPRFRQDYGSPMLQIFRDSCRDAERKRGTWGVCQLWLPTLWDLIVTVWSERITEGVSMSTRQWQRLGSLAALILGAYLVISAYLRFAFPYGGNGEASDPKILIPLITLYFVLPIVATMALQVRLQPDLGRLGSIVGAVILLTLSVSNLSYLIFFWELILRAPTTYILATNALTNVVYVSEPIYAISTLLYGLLALKSRLGPIRNILPLLTYGPLAFSILEGGFLTVPVIQGGSLFQFFLFGVVFPLLWGVGWIAIGVFLWLSHRPQVHRVSPAFSPQA